MKTVRITLATTGCFLAVCALIFGLPLMWGVWLPDVVKPRAIVLSKLITTNGDHLRLTQFWVGDGYATEFFHTEINGRTWHLAIDGDAPKAWDGFLLRTNDLISIRVLNTQLFYDMRSHVVTDTEGKPQLVQTFPPGTPISPPR